MDGLQDEELSLNDDERVLANVALAKRAGWMFFTNQHFIALSIFFYMIYHLLCDLVILIQPSFLLPYLPAMNQPGDWFLFGLGLFFLCIFTFIWFLYLLSRFNKRSAEAKSIRYIITQERVIKLTKYPRFHQTSIYYSNNTNWTVVKDLGFLTYGLYSLYPSEYDENVPFYYYFNDLLDRRGQSLAFLTAGQIASLQAFFEKRTVSASTVSLPQEPDATSNKHTSIQVEITAKEQRKSIEKNTVAVDGLSDEIDIPLLKRHICIFPQKHLIEYLLFLVLYLTIAPINETNRYENIYIIFGGIFIPYIGLCLWSIYLYSTEGMVKLAQNELIRPYQFGNIPYGCIIGTSIKKGYTGNCQVVIDASLISNKQFKMGALNTVRYVISGLSLDNAKKLSREIAKRVPR